MSTIVEATLPAREFALHQTLQQAPDAEFEIVRLVAHGADRTMPFVWATGERPALLPELLAEDSSTTGVDVVTELDDRCLLRMEWRNSTSFVYDLVCETDATVLDACGKNGAWRLRLLFPEHESVSATYDFCDDHGVDVNLNRVYQLSNSFCRDQLDLTEEQYEAIASAYELGYYDVPRGINQETLAARFDLSHQALSERLRRGHKALVASTLNPGLAGASPN